MAKFGEVYDAFPVGGVQTDEKFMVVVPVLEKARFPFGDTVLIVVTPDGPHRERGYILHGTPSNLKPSKEPDDEA